MLHKTASLVSWSNTVEAVTLMTDYVGCMTVSFVDNYYAQTPHASKQWTFAQPPSSRTICDGPEPCDAK